MSARLLNPKVIVRQFKELTWTETKRLIATRKSKKYGFKDVAYEVEEVSKDRYHVRMEYIV